MKKRILFFLCAGLLSTNLLACNSAINENNKENNQKTENLQVDKKLLTIKITIPKEYSEDTTQEDLDALVKEDKVKSATLEENGSVTYVMTKGQHKNLMKELASSLKESFDAMIESEDYPNIKEITPNKNFTNFTVKTSSQELDMNESFSSLMFFMSGTLYNLFDGKDSSQIHVDFVNTDTGNIIDSFDSSDLENTQTSQDEPNRDFPEGKYSDMGSGNFSIQTPGGDSADGIAPVLFVAEDDSLIQIGFYGEEMDGSHLSYIYIDGMENSKEQIGEMYQGSLDLQGNALSKGLHTVEVVQYDTDEPSGEIITYKSCQYEVK